MAKPKPDTPAKTDLPATEDASKPKPAKRRPPKRSKAQPLLEKPEGDASIEAEIEVDQAREEPTDFPIVGVGASAGGLEAFRELLHHLPENTGMGFVLVQHLDPRHESLLTGLLQTSTKLAMVEARDGLRVEPNHVYVIPPNCNLGILHGVLQVMTRIMERGKHLPVDYFLESLAEDRGSRAMGVILSGTASDGTLGLKAIKAASGITFAQDEESAEYFGMPGSAIAAGCVDFVLPPRSIARELARIARHPYLLQERSVEADLGESPARRTGPLRGGGPRRILDACERHPAVRDRDRPGIRAAAACRARPRRARHPDAGREHCGGAAGGDDAGPAAGRAGGRPGLPGGDAGLRGGAGPQPPHRLSAGRAPGVPRGAPAPGASRLGVSRHRGDESPPAADVPAGARRGSAGRLGRSLVDRGRSAAAGHRARRRDPAACLARARAQ